MSAPLLDRAVIDDLFGFIGAEAAASVIDLFVAESRDFVGRIEQADPADPTGRETIRRTAHSLKSGAGQIGAAALSEAAAAVEHAAQHTAGDLGGAVQALRRCADRTAAALAALLQSR